LPAPLRLTPTLCAAALLVCEGAASGYVPSTTAKSLTRLRWFGSNCVMIRVSSLGSDDVTDGSAVQAAKRAMENWRKATSSCSFLQFQVLADSPTAVASFDKERGAVNENVIVWVEKGWSHDPQAAALTTVYFIEKEGAENDGQILDADIELNGERFRFATTGAADRTDVENTVTHELGHLMGLDHPCDDGARAPVPTDHTGAKIPSCFPAYKLTQWIKDTTMYNFADQGETKKRSPETDDIAGICQTYPLSSDPGTCGPPPDYRDDGGCAVASPLPSLRLGGPLWLLLLGLALLARRRA
jgi:hypothetical protein